MNSVAYRILWVNQVPFQTEKVTMENELSWM